MNQGTIAAEEATTLERLKVLREHVKEVRNHAERTALKAGEGSPPKDASKGAVDPRLPLVEQLNREIARIEEVVTEINDAIGRTSAQLRRLGAGEDDQPIAA